MREQALSNRDPGSDQETAREASDDSERLERGPNMVQIFVHPCPCVCMCCPNIFPPTATELVGPFMAAGSRFLDLRSKEAGPERGRARKARFCLGGTIANVAGIPIDTRGRLARTRPYHTPSPNAPSSAFPTMTIPGMVSTG